MAKKIAEIEGIGPVYAEKLSKAGVLTVEGLLEKGASRPGRKNIAEDSGIDESKILNWVNKADLFRIKGVGPQFSELLEAAGVDTVPELASRKPEALLEALAKVNEKKNLVNLLPGLSRVEAWVKQAKSLKRAVEY